MLNIGINGNVQNLHEQTLFKTKVGLNDRGEKNLVLGWHISTSTCYKFTNLTWARECYIEVQTENKNSGQVSTHWKETGGGNSHQNILQSLCT